MAIERYACAEMLRCHAGCATLRQRAALLRASHADAASWLIAAPPRAIPHARLITDATFNSERPPPLLRPPISSRHFRRHIPSRCFRHTPRHATLITAAFCRLSAFLRLYFTFQHIIASLIVADFIAASHAFANSEAETAKDSRRDRCRLRCRRSRGQD